VDAGVVITDDPLEDVRLAIEFRDTEIAEQAAVIRSIHEAIGEAPESDDATLAEAVRKRVTEQAEEIERLKANIANWERKEIRRASDCHGQEQRAEKAERERDEARKALVWVEDNIQSIDLKEPVEEPLEKWRKE
jgi:hypothetical protein